MQQLPTSDATSVARKSQLKNKLTRDGNPANNH
jgi:hypothetical protein